MCESDDPSTVVATHPIEQQHEIVIHKKSDGVLYKEDDEAHYLTFYPGFPRGGESFADVHAPWGTCFSDVPRDGAAIIKVKK